MTLAARGSGRAGWDDGDGDDDDAAARELSLLEAEQRRIQAELEAARLKAQLAKLQQERGGLGVAGGGGSGSAASSSGGGGSSGSGSSSKRGGGSGVLGGRDRERERERESGGAEDNAPKSKRTGLQAAVPLSAKGPLGAAARKKAEAAWGRDAPPKGWAAQARANMQQDSDFPSAASSSSGSGGSSAGAGAGVAPRLPGSGLDADKEARYAEVVGELVSALQDVGKDTGVDIKTIVRGLKAARADGAGGGGGGGGLAPPPVRPPAFDERKVQEAMRKGVGNALVKRIVEAGGGEGALESLAGEAPDSPLRLERLAAWGSLVEKTIASSRYQLTAEKVLGMRELADRLLPPAEFGPGDVTAAHLAAIRAVSGALADEYPEIRRRRGNMLYVLLNLPWASRGLGNVLVHQEEVAIGQGISMEASVGLGCRALFEATLAEAMPSSTEALSLMDAVSFRKATRALLEMGGLAQRVLAVTRMPGDEAVKGIAFFLVPWLRRVAKRALEDEGPGAAALPVGGEGVARLGMVMELGRYAAECLALAAWKGSSGMPAAGSPDYENVVQAVLADKINGVGVELSSGVRSQLLGGYIRSWVVETLMQRSLPVPWADGEGRLRPGDLGAWDLARQVLTLSEMQLLFIAKETVPVVLGELMAEVFLEHGGAWPRGDGSFQRDWERVYRRLKYDKYEGGGARAKAVRVMADRVLAAGRGEGGRAQAVEWGCETLELPAEEFAELAREQATFELQTEILEQLLGPGALSAGEVGDRIAASAAQLRLEEPGVRRAATAAVQVHIGNLAARALFADMEGQPMKAFKEIESTLAFINGDAAALAGRFGCKLDPTARIADEDGLQLANICTKMITRRQFADAARAFLELIGYSDRVGY